MSKHIILSKFNTQIKDNSFFLYTLIIILLRLGFGISKDDLKKVGAPAIKLSCIPGLFEGFAIATVLSIVVTAPIGAIGISLSGEKLLS